MLLHGETPVFITTAIAATVAEVGGSTFLETFLATEVQKKFHETDHVYTRYNAWPETCFASPLHTSFS